MLKTIWNALGDTRIAVVLLLAASAMLMTGAFIAEGHFSFFMELNHIRIQDWLKVHWTSRPELIWWIPALFIIMGLLGINTFICASNRCVRLIDQRHSLSPGRFFYLLTPSLVHFLFIIVMLGHLTTFVAGRWETAPLTAGGRIQTSDKASGYHVKAVEDQFFPSGSALRDQLSQTLVTLVSTDGENKQIQYARPVFIDGRFLLLDKARPKNRATQKPASSATANKTGRQEPASTEARSGQGSKTDRPFLLVISDPGLGVIVTGLTLIMGLMIAYFILKPKLARGYNEQGNEG